MEGLITQRKQHLQQLDDLLKSVFLDMFGDPVRNEKGWEKTPFTKVGKFISGATPSKARDDFWQGIFPWVSPKDMKVSKISDSIDHISELVFEETNLKRIKPNHLLIVVRGMILAHSFPLAINAVPVSINQDMKAISPDENFNVVYLQHCLNAMKRQILNLISSAGHGTKKFDQSAMEKLLIPKPSPEKQSKFAAVAEVHENIKLRYQASLSDLENLYGSLSQKAFKGELDLSIVPLPAEDASQKQPEKDTTNTTNEAVGSTADMFAEIFNSDEPPMSSVEGRQKLLQRGFYQFVQNDENDNTPSIEEFWQSAQLQALDYTSEENLDNEEEGKNNRFSLNDYDRLKDWIFSQIREGKFKQTRNSIELNDRQALGNRVVLIEA